MTRFIRRQAVEELTGLAKSTIYQMMREGRFPRAVKLGGRAVAWPECEIHNWLEEKIAEREASNE
jgi:prophage regulatory protein